MSKETVDFWLENRNPLVIHGKPIVVELFDSGVVL
jgi:hypothetical protein